MFFSGLEAVSRNINHKNPDLKLYEFGKIYWKSDENNIGEPIKNYNENNHLGIWLSGNYQKANWNQEAKETDFFYLKTTVDAVMEKSGINTENLKINDTKSDLFEFALEYKKNNNTIATYGLVKHTLTDVFDIKQDVFYADINMELLLKIALSNKTKFKVLPKFPSVSRDLSLLIDKNISFQQLKELAFDKERKYLISVSLFDVYEGENIEKGKKSYALNFVLRDEDKTMKDKQIDKIMKKLTDSYINEFGASLR